MWSDFHSPWVPQQSFTSWTWSYISLRWSWGWLSVTLGPNKCLLCISSFCFLINQRCLFPVFRLCCNSDWRRGSDVGPKAAEEPPPAGCSASSERRQHPRIAPRDHVKVSAESCFTAQSLCWGLFVSVSIVSMWRRRKGGVKALYWPIKPCSSPEGQKDNWWLMMAACLEVKNPSGTLREAANNQSILLTNQHLHFRLLWVSLNLMLNSKLASTQKLLSLSHRKKVVWTSTHVHNIE